MDHGFFNIISPDEFRKLLGEFPRLGAQTVALDSAAGRALAMDVVSGEDLPLVNRSCMDGFAVMARDTFGASASSPAYLEVSASLAIDQIAESAIDPGQCAAIATGGTLPDGADAVVMIEHTEDLGAGTIEVGSSVAPGDNVMLRGEDAATGQTVLEAGTSLRPAEVGLLAALGMGAVSVGRMPRAGIVSTGDELVPISGTPRPGQVRDVNTHALAALVREVGAEPVCYGLVRDDLESLTQALKKAVDECDCVFVSGGSSVGVRDLTVAALKSLGAEVKAHGVALSPGKPTILADCGGKAVFGLPGQVTSAQVVMLVFGCPFLRHVAGHDEAFDVSLRPTVPAVLSRNLASKQGREDYVRVRLEDREGLPPLAHPVTGKSGLLKTLVQAHGLVGVPASSEGLEQDANVLVWLI